MESKEKIRKAARRLYLRNRGGDYAGIEREIRRKGLVFNRQVFYTMRHSYGITLGWPERYGWDEELKPNERKALERLGRGRHKFEHWLNQGTPGWSWSMKYQRYVYDQLWRVTLGTSRRLMIFMPPRHGKSETVTVRYTAWRLLRDPTLNVILGSYNQRLADKFSRKIKRIVRSGHSITNGNTTPTATGAARILDTASEWETGGGGVVRAAGVGAGVAGFGAGLIVIDDPVKNRAEAESVTYREKVWEWFNDDIYTRLEPNAAIILIQTRWHEDDLAGRLLKEAEDGGEDWDVVKLPAIAEENDVLGRKSGEALCPKRYGADALERYRRKLGTYSFSALYQQNPVPVEGGRFKREWFTNVVERAPDGLQWKRGYDLAVSTRTSADYKASFRCAKDAEGNLYIADGFRKRIEYPEQRRFALERMATETDTEHGIESALHGKAFVQDLRRMEQSSRYAFRSVKVDGDKLTRALAWLNVAEEGKLFLVRGPWIDEFVDEVCRFPKARYDDQVDAVSIAVSMLSERRTRMHRFD